MGPRIYISTTVYSKAYLTRMWESRHHLKEYERRGFAQFFYLTICSHVESRLASVIKTRLGSIRSMLDWRKIDPVRFHDNETVHTCPVTPIVESLMRILEAMGKEADTAPLIKLTELFKRTFPQPLQGVLGEELNLDLQALMGLRNLFAHGRDLVMEFEGLSGGAGSLEGNPLQKPAERLHKAGIIANLEINSRNYQDFQRAFFSDDALKYFYERTQRIDHKLDAFNTFLPERARDHIPELPDLFATEDATHGDST